MWLAYVKANRILADAAAAGAAPGATVLVHGHEFQLVPILLRLLRPDVRIALSLDIPFPDVDLLQWLPNHEDVLFGLSGADHIAVQTARCGANLLGVTAQATGRRPTVSVHPASVDTSRVAEHAILTSVLNRAKDLRRRLNGPLILSIVPADEEQGIERQLHAYDRMLRDGTVLPEDTTIMVVLTGGRHPGPELASRIARQAARINTNHAPSHRPAVHLVIDNPRLADRVVLYQAADLLVATPLRQAATTVALEFAAGCRSDAAIVLSNTSGTVQALHGAYLTNPFDIDAIGATITTALRSPPNERTARMSLVRSYLAAYDNHAWASSLVAALPV